MRYDRRSGSLPPHAAALLELSGGLLSVGQYAPNRGSQLVRSGDRLEWDSIAVSSQRIASVEFSRIQISVTRPLLFHLLDDDPHAVAEMDVTLTTERGETQAVRVQFWDYARVTPWSFQRLGEGWKLVSVTW